MNTPPRSPAEQVLDDPLSLRRHLVAQGLEADPDTAEMQMLPDAYSDVLRRPPHPVGKREAEPHSFLMNAQTIVLPVSGFFGLTLACYGQPAGDRPQRVAMGRYLLEKLQAVLDRGGLRVPDDWHIAMGTERDQEVTFGPAPSLVCQLLFAEDGGKPIFIECKRPLQPGEWDAWRFSEL